MIHLSKDSGRTNRCQRPRLISSSQWSATNENRQRATASPRSKSYVQDSLSNWLRWAKTAGKELEDKSFAATLNNKNRTIRRTGHEKFSVKSFSSRNAQLGEVPVVWRYQSLVGNFIAQKTRIMVMQLGGPVCLMWPCGTSMRFSAGWNRLQEYSTSFRIQNVLMHLHGESFLDPEFGISEFVSPSFSSSLVFSSKRALCDSKINFELLKIQDRWAPQPGISNNFE